MQTDSLFISAGDPSGDNAASRLAEMLRRTYPSYQLLGLGGPKLARLGQKQLAQPEDLAVIGFWEVAKRFNYFRTLLNQCVAEIRRNRPRVVILVDYPGFNLRLAKRIRSLGIPIVYYISPQVWAWGKDRTHLIRRLVDLMLVILPFEASFYAEQGVACKFVGHYLLEDISREFIASKPPDSSTLAILPGSRPQEIERMLVPMLEAARRLHLSYGMRTTVVGIPNRFDYEPIVSRYRDAGVMLSYDDSRNILHGSRYVLTKSGTATLEAAIIGRPMVIVYKTGFVTYQIARRLVRLEAIGLVNLVLGRNVVPELIQGQASPENMVREIERIARDTQQYESVRRELNRVPDILGGTGASERAANLIISLSGW